MSRKQGAPVGALFVWGIRGRQVMRKIGPNKYRGKMFGHKRLLIARRG